MPKVAEKAPRSTSAVSSTVARAADFVPNVEKRNGAIVPFDLSKITAAIYKSMLSVDEGSEREAELMANKVYTGLVRISKRYHNFVPTVEGIQDAVEKALMVSDYVKSAKSYILYREERARLRAAGVEVPERVRALTEEGKKHFRNPLAEFVYYRTYARWVEGEGRRETWTETIDRYMGFMREKLGNKLKPAEYREIREAILSQQAMPSMRLLQFAGDAARKTNVCAYNCSYIAPSKLQDFGEIMYISMCGTGVGFSVESQNIQKLPQIKHQTGKMLPTYTIPDSKEGWADALVFGMKTWYDGTDVRFDYSHLRPAGARLKTMGGRSSGPDPLRALLDFAREKILKRQGKRLSNLDAHDVICKIGEVVVAGGVRRSAMISLSDFDDADIRDAKKGQFYLSEPQRSIANNSAVYLEKPSTVDFMEEWIALMKSGTGERGMFNRGDLVKTLPKRRLDVLKGSIGTLGTNPCVTGDTLVYTADGRGNVPIKQLAEERKDVPVFCLDRRGVLAVRYMRHPRLTGKREKIYDVALDDGSTVRVTGNHQFRLKTGEYRKAAELQGGDSLHVLTRYAASLKDVFSSADRTSQDYWWVNNGMANNKAEHRLIAEFYFNAKLRPGFVVHHKDRNAQNNKPSNLEILSKQDHDALHGDLMRGDRNPMRRAAHEWDAAKWTRYRAAHSVNNAGVLNSNYSGASDEMLRRHMVSLTRELGHRISASDWVRYAKKRRLPQYFSKWRADHLGGITGLAKWAAQKCGVEHIDADPRVIRSYNKYTSQGYNCEIKDNTLVIMKLCEVCRRDFSTSISGREYGVCSISCGLQKKWSDEAFRWQTLEKINNAHTERKSVRRVGQVEAYNNVKFALGRTPTKNEWIGACREAGLSHEISRTSSPFRTYADLEEAAARYNHKVVSVRETGHADVYNGTVDEFHNFFIGAFAGVTRNGKQKFCYVNNLQCGEIVLQSKQFCNLSEVVARSEDTEATLLAKTRIAAILGTYQSTLTYLPYLSREWKQHCDDERLLGVSITGQWDCPAARTAGTLEKMRKEAVHVNEQYAKRFGVARSTCVTCVKPSGTLSQMVDAASGMHPRYSPYYIRRVRISSTDSLFKMLRDQQVPFYPEVGQSREDANTYVIEFPVKAPDGSVFKDDITALEQLEHWKLVKQHYTEHNPSCTIYIGESEWIDVAHWLYNNWEIIGGLSFLPRSNHVYQLAPYEEIDETRYHELAKRFEHVDYAKIVTYEKHDETEQARELACAGGVCEI